MGPHVFTFVELFVEIFMAYYVDMTNQCLLTTRVHLFKTILVELIANICIQSCLPFKLYLPAIDWTQIVSIEKGKLHIVAQDQNFLTFGYEFDRHSIFCGDYLLAGVILV